MKLENAAPHLHFSLDPVQYPAIAAGWAIDTWRSESYFEASVESGATTVLADIERTERNCQGGVKYLFTGYSQGAWVVHRALWKLAANKSLKQLLGKVVGVALFGDPKFAPFNEIVRDTKVSVPYYGVLALSGALDPEINVPKELTRVTASYCFTTDPICQGPPNPLWAEEMAACLVACRHYRYIEEGKTNKAATFLTPKLPAKSVWPRLTGAKPPAGTVGVPYSWTATVAPTARLSYTWSAPDSLPPGLEFSPPGVLSGTPKKAGRYTFRIMATQVPQGRYVTGTVSVVINPGTSPPSGCSSGACTISAWGSNVVGELGNGTTTGSPTPVEVADLSGVTAVAAGIQHSLALRTDGTAWEWGANFFSEPEDPTLFSRTPVQVSGLSDVTAIAAGGLHSLALRADGTVWAWGFNDYGQLGNGTTTSSSTPVQVSGLSDVTAIAAGGLHSLALRTDGAVWAWGYNFSGQLGNGTTTNSAIPVQVSGLANVTAIAAGGADGEHSLALRTDGAVWAWGYNFSGQLGNGTSTTSPTPVQVSGLSDVTAIAAGFNHSLALRTDGTVRAWGGNTSGQLGNGITTASPTPTPVQVSGLSGVTTIDGGALYSLAVLTDGTVRAWGDNRRGALGDGTLTSTSTPVQSSGLSGVTATAAGSSHSLALHP